MNGCLGVFEAQDGLECGSTRRGGAVLDHGAGTPGEPSADAAILRSEIPDFHDIPRSAWRLVDPVEVDEPENGIVRLDPYSERIGGSQEYLVFVEGRGVMRVYVDGDAHGYLIGGSTSC